jgi:hypothetical protein
VIIPERLAVLSGPLISREKPRREELASRGFKPLLLAKEKSPLEVVDQNLIPVRIRNSSVTIYGTSTGLCSWEFTR